ncbi:DUF92 domain-containing protein [Nannizzia gypsea CBS 118893]|uniref:DUF92 domain-containing protein n=1 Tax=Arthroderma gypseum (strain ATCC MYA-4604 / CBS 118893) TaxID=535722 RepID=E4UVR0_ARTGP|nr:DUF92 domain-containing protein [Nannizzia gypsea CBS 118893]EFR02387.1 DUF92 domain-containing protein [Nannizzia gypsea CBS 118893]
MKAIIAVPATLLLVHRAWSRKSLTPLGIVFAALTAVIHAIHPSSTPFALLIVFFLGGTRVTKVKHDVKARLTISATGAGGGEGSRTHIQVLANSGAASILILLDCYRIYYKNGDLSCLPYGRPESLLMVGIVSTYAAVAADTYSSELGILSKSAPRLITSPTFRKVPPGTNGGITLIGVAAGSLGAFTIAITSLLLPFCSLGSPVVGGAKLGLDGGSAWSWNEKALWVLAITIWGTLGSLLDSLLGGLLQATVVDKQTGKVVEGSGGQKVLIHAGALTSKIMGDPPIRQETSLRTNEDIANALSPHTSPHENYPGISDPAHESRKITAGSDILDNNAVNFLMASIMAIGGVAMASVIWGIPIDSIFRRW